MTLETYVERLRLNSAKTAESYELSIRKYCGILGIDPNKLIQEIKGGRKDTIETLQGLVTWSSKLKHSPVTTRLYLTAWCQFLRYEGVRVEKDDIKNRVMPPKKIKTYGGRPFTSDEIRTILRVAQFKYRAVFLTALSSGLRAGELGALQIKDISLTKSPVEIHVRAETSKSREERTTYVSDEAAYQLREITRDRGPDEYVFGNDKPLSTDSITSAATRILKRAKIRNVNGKVSFHSTRKWFTTFLVLGKVPLPVVELMCGRQIGVTQSYLKPTEEQIREYYSKALQRATLSEIRDMTTEQVATQQSELQMLKNILKDRLLADLNDCWLQTGMDLSQEEASDDDRKKTVANFEKERSGILAQLKTLGATDAEISQVESGFTKKEK